MSRIEGQGKVPEKGNNRDKRLTKGSEATSKEITSVNALAKNPTTVRKKA